MDWKKISMAAFAGAVLVGAGIGAGFALDKDEVEVQIVNAEPIIVEVPVEVVKEVIKEVEVPGEPVEVIVEVEDDAFLKLACDRLMYEDVQECKEEVSAESAAFKLALELFDDEDDLFDLLEDDGFIKDEDDAAVLKVYDDFEDVVVKKSDFEDEEYKFVIDARIEDEDREVKKKLSFTIEVDRDEAEIVKVVEA